MKKMILICALLFTAVVYIENNVFANSNVFSENMLGKYIYIVADGNERYESYYKLNDFINTLSNSASQVGNKVQITRTRDFYNISIRSGNGFISFEINSSNHLKSYAISNGKTTKIFSDRKDPHTLAAMCRDVLPFVDKVAKEEQRIESEKKQSQENEQNKFINNNIFNANLHMPFFAGLDYTDSMSSALIKLMKVQSLKITDVGVEHNIHDCDTYDMKYAQSAFAFFYDWKPEDYNKWLKNPKSNVANVLNNISSKTCSPNLQAEMMLFGKEAKVFLGFNNYYKGIAHLSSISIRILYNGDKEWTVLTDEIKGFFTNKYKKYDIKLGDKGYDFIWIKDTFDNVIHVNGDATISYKVSDKLVSKIKSINEADKKNKMKQKINSNSNNGANSSL